MSHTQETKEYNKTQTNVTPMNSNKSYSKQYKI